MFKKYNSLLISLKGRSRINFIADLGQEEHELKYGDEVNEENVGRKS